MMRTKVCIVGGGPAGSTASLFLSRYGVPHILVDRQEFPRDKVCGESFSGMVFHVLRELGLLEVFEQRGVIFRTWRVVLKLRPNQILRIEFPKTATPRIHAMRRFFDHELLSEATLSPLATVLTGQMVSNIVQHPDSVTLTDEATGLHIEADMVINCVGEQVSQLSKLVGEDYNKRGTTYIFWRAYYQNVRWDSSENQPCEIHLTTKPKVYCLVLTPLPNGLTTVEVGVQQRHHIGGAATLEAVCHDLLTSDPDLSARFADASPIDRGKGVGMKLGPLPRYLADNRLLLAGSATGSINPITGFGVGHAMRTGQLAAAAAAEAVQQNNFSAAFFLAHYDRPVRKRLRNDYFYGLTLNILQRLLPYLAPFARVFIFSQRFIQFATQRDFSRQFWNPLFYIRTLLATNPK